MDIINQQVRHRRFGDGKIISRDGKVLTVYFNEYGARAFAYPDAFEDFLTALDGDFAKTAEADLAERRAEKEAERERAAAQTPEPAPAPAKPKPRARVKKKAVVSG